MRPLLVAGLAACLFAVLAAAQSTVVIPNGLAANPSNVFVQEPWGSGEQPAGQIRTQDIYDATHFTLQGINQPIIITRLRWRTLDVGGNAGTYNLVTVQVSTSPVDQSNISGNFATNRGADVTTVYAGPVSVLPGAVPHSWYVDIWLNTPFRYDPSTGGDLNIDVMTNAAGWIGARGPGVEVASNGCLASRLSNVGFPASSGIRWYGLGPVVELSYHSTSGLYAGFSATPTSGTSPFLVQFTDRTFTSDPGGITSWNWDVDGDSVIDYTTQNPSHTYACGTHGVSLTVTDATHAASTLTRNGLITVDQMAANFAWSQWAGFAPLFVQFTDTSTGPVTGWSWDLDGDSVADSTLRNPTFVYSSPGTYTVSLTTTNGCRTSTQTRPNLISVLAPGAVPAPPELLQYQFNEIWGNNVANTASTNAAPAFGTVLHTTNWSGNPNRSGFAGNQGYGCLSHTTNAGSVPRAGAVDTGWKCSLTGSFSASFWLRRDANAPFTTAEGHAFSDGLLLCYAGGGAGNGMLFHSPSTGFVHSGFTVNGTPGVWQHVAVVVDDATGQVLWYSNGTASPTVGSFPPNSFAYANNYVLGVGGNGVAGLNAIGLRGYDMDDFRLYARTLTPTEVRIISFSQENASAGRDGTSCPGPGGTPVIMGNGRPTLGNAAFAIDLANAEDNRLAAIVLGLGPLWTNLINLQPLLGAGCRLQTDVVAVCFHTTVAGAASQPLAIPGNSSYAGLHVYAQWLVRGTQGAVTQMLDINMQ